jgi:hypothetical protein
LDSKVLVPLGSFSGGFSSTAGYVPGNEAQLISEEFIERRSTCQADQFLKALPVFIPITPVVPRRADLGKPFGFGSGRFVAAAFRSCCTRTMRHRISSTSRYRSRARKQSRLCSHITPAKFDVKQKLL